MVKSKEIVVIAQILVSTEIITATLCKRWKLQLSSNDTVSLNVNCFPY